MLIQIFKSLIKKRPKINALLERDYFRNLGLACVVGSTSGFFLKSHNSHQLVSLATLLFIGIIFSYIGIKEINNND